MTWDSRSTIEPPNRLTRQREQRSTQAARDPAAGVHIGFIRSGQADPEVVVRIEALGSLGDILEEFGMDEFGGPLDDDDDGPRVLSFGPNDD